MKGIYLFIIGLIFLNLGVFGAHLSGPLANPGFSLKHLEVPGAILCVVGLIQMGRDIKTKK